MCVCVCVCVYSCVCVRACVCVCVFIQPLRTNGMRHNVNNQAKFNGFEIRLFF